MSIAKRVAAGCLMTPIVLVASCAGKMYVDARLYDLPGQVLKSNVAPTQSLDTALQVAEALDAYVQPRFNILRDRNFGAFRIVYRQHAGIVQLKVDTPAEQRVIANVNAANREYAICLLHCAPKPSQEDYPADYHVTPKLGLLYYNQQSIASSWDHSVYYRGTDIDKKHHLNLDAYQATAVAALPRLMAGREARTGDKEWDVLMRPVLASSQACLSCHRDAKPGAALGVMLYAVHKTRRNAQSNSGKLISLVP